MVTMLLLLPSAITAAVADTTIAAKTTAGGVTIPSPSLSPVSLSCPVPLSPYQTFQLWHCTPLPAWATGRKRHAR